MGKVIAAWLWFMFLAGVAVGAGILAALLWLTL